MSVKIQINSLEVLEKLIGDDKNLEIQVKESILDGFAKKYLKSIANSYVLEALKKSVIEEIAKTDFFGMLQKNPPSYIKAYSLSDDFRNKVKQEVSTLVRNQIKDALNEPINDINKQINERMDYLASSAAKALSDEVVKGNLDKLVQKKLSDVLGLNK